MTVLERSREAYVQHYEEIYSFLSNSALESSRNGVISQQRIEEIERIAQKDAIRLATIDVMREFPDASSTEIWRAVNTAHVFRKSGITDPDVIDAVESASQSWKKSSGHAFEEMIKQLGNIALMPTIGIILQRDLTRLIKDGQIANQQRDIDWLKIQLDKEIFDLYAIVRHEGKDYVFGCIQSKASVRDRVTRDREPSVHAMEHFFWSTIIVFDGDFLRLPKFNYMVNGGNDEFPSNGWHGLYVFSDAYDNDRIYSTDINMKHFKEHAVEAAAFWLTQRQWFDADWKARE